MNTSKFIFQNLTHQFQLQKTLRFELIPQGRTLEHIEKNGLLEADELKANRYKQVKEWIDLYHKAFIEKVLREPKLEGLSEYRVFFENKQRNEKDEEAFKKLKSDLRKKISSFFKDEPNKTFYKRLFDKELIKADLPDFLREQGMHEEATMLLEEFGNFTTYFKGFHENRKNLYVAEDKSTAIAFRLIDENLPRYMQNLLLVEKHREVFEQFFPQIQERLGKELDGLRVEEFFSEEGFNLCLNGSGIHQYNTILGGVKGEEEEGIPGLNMLINLYRQKHKLKSRELPTLFPLHKQILSDRESSSFRPEPYEDGDENTVVEDLLKLGDQWFNPEGFVPQLVAHLTKLKDEEQDQLFVNNKANALSAVSQATLGHWAVLGEALSSYWNHVHDVKENALKGKALTAKEKWLKQPYFSFQEIELALRHYMGAEGKENASKWNVWLEKPLVQYFNYGLTKEAEKTKVDTAKAAWGHAENILRELQNHENPKLKTKETKDAIKAYFDACLDLLHFIKPLVVDLEQCEASPTFYGDFLSLYHEMDDLVPLYNKVRNYMTKKPYSYEKFKLNFNKGTLLDGWSQSKETDNLCVLFREGNNFFLGIMDRKHNKSFVKPPMAKEEEPVMQKVVYNLLPDPSKMLPKCFTAPYFRRIAKEKTKDPEQIVSEYSKEKGLIKPKLDVLDAYAHKKHTKENFQRNGFEQVVEYFKEGAQKHPDWHVFDFKFKPTSAYKDVSDFYQEVTEQGYCLDFVDIPKRYINDLVESGKLYLFQIYNKDFSKYSKGKPNLHTMYWKAIFDPQNLKAPIYKLNGEAEVFFRKKSLEYTQEQLDTGHHREELKGKFDYPIVKDRRFAFDKFQFHVPITLNHARKNQAVGPQVLRYIQKHKEELHYIGLDRGERHLLYLSVVNAKGEIIEQRSLNKIGNGFVKDGKPYTHDYQGKLLEKERNRDSARKDWDAVESIKELKEGYMSIIVHEIAQLVVKYNAVVILEDLNFGFKRGRFKVERQVYQKFERKLIEKLNHLVFKEVAPQEPGGLLKALQLTDQFTSFTKLGKQSGILFYLPAAYTSKIDPLTGFINQVPWKYTNLEAAQKWIGNFKRISYHAELDLFEWVLDQRDFLSNPAGCKHQWVLRMDNQERWHWNSKAEGTNGKGAYSPIRLKEQFEDLLARQNISYNGNSKLLEDIQAVKDASFFKTLFFFLRTLTQLRYNNGKSGAEEEDFILSAVANPGMEPFDTRKAKQGLPLDADANGAYHIAMKGLMTLGQLKEKPNGKLEIPKLDKSAWLCFMQQRSNQG